MTHALDFTPLASLVVGVMGARVLYERPGDPGFAVPGAFDRYALAVDMPDMQVATSTNQAQLMVALADFPPGFVPQQGDRLQVAQLGERQLDATAPLPGAIFTTFDVRDVQRDGAGGAILVLSGRVPDDLA